MPGQLPLRIDWIGSARKIIGSAVGPECGLSSHPCECLNPAGLVSFYIKQVKGCEGHLPSISVYSWQVPSTPYPLSELSQRQGLSRLSSPAPEHGLSCTVGAQLTFAE